MNINLTSFMYHFVRNNSACMLSNIPGIDIQTLKTQIEVLEKNGILFKNEEPLIDFICKKTTKPKYLLTFDDSLACHAKLVLPLLEQYGVKAAFSIYTHPILSKTISHLEKQRFLQYNYNNYNDFLEQLHQIFIELDLHNKYGEILLPTKKNIDSCKNFLASETYYSPQERYYRYIREKLLSQSDFKKVIDNFFEKSIPNDKQLHKELYLTIEDIKNIHNSDHVILGHSTTHPMHLENFSTAEIYGEIVQNLNDLENITGQRPEGFAYPCGKLNHNILNAIYNSKLKYAFVAGDIQNYNVEAPWLLKLPRTDVADFSCFEVKSTNYSTCFI